MTQERKVGAPRGNQNAKRESKPDGRIVISLSVNAEMQEAIRRRINHRGWPMQPARIKAVAREICKEALLNDDATDYKELYIALSDRWNTQQQALRNAGIKIFSKDVNPVTREIWWTWESGEGVQGGNFDTDAEALAEALGTLLPKNKD